MCREKVNKYKTKELDNNKLSVRFPSSWVGDRIPEFVIVPVNRKLKVKSMRNGIIIFDNNTSGTYRRTKDDNKTQERTIIIEYSE